MNKSDQDKLISLVNDMGKSFQSYANAIEWAQKMYHNYTYWTNEETDPIYNAMIEFYKNYDAAIKMLNEVEYD